MHGQSKVIEHLNQLLANEIVAISQYLLHSRMVRSQGLDKLADKLHADSVEEMRHADQLIERILFLEGTPDMECEKLRVGGDVPEMLKYDLALERKGHPELCACIQHCEETGDFGSRDLAAQILSAEESHIDWLETQLELIEQVGLANYKQSQIA